MYKYNPVTGKLDLVNPEFVLTQDDLIPQVSDPITATVFHNAAIPASAGYLCLTINFAVKATFFGTTLDTTIDNHFWNWTEGFFLIRRNGIGESAINCDAQTIGAKPAVKVKPMGDGTALLVADLSSVGASNDYFLTVDGDKFPVFDEPAAQTTTYPQLKTGSGDNSNFQANFGANFSTPLLTGSTPTLKVFSQSGRAITVRNGTSGQNLHIDGSHSLCQGSGADIPKKTVDLVNAISLIGEYRIPIYIKASNPVSECLVHNSPFVQHDIYIGLDDENHMAKVTYDPDADDNPAARWYDGKVQANLPGAANITVSEADRRPEQPITIL